MIDQQELGSLIEDLADEYRIPDVSDIHARSQASTKQLPVLAAVAVSALALTGAWFGLNALSDDSPSVVTSSPEDDKEVEDTVTSPTIEVGVEQFLTLKELMERGTETATEQAAMEITLSVVETDQGLPFESEGNIGFEIHIVEVRGSDERPYYVLTSRSIWESPRSGEPVGRCGTDSSGALQQSADATVIFNEGFFPPEIGNWTTFPVACAQAAPEPLLRRLLASDFTLLAEDEQTIILRNSDESARLVIVESPSG